MPGKIESGRITKAIKTRYGSWTHEVVLDRPEELDRELRAWLRESYLFSKE